MTRVIICGTHPSQYNGYSKVMFELCKELAAYPDIEIIVYGFQNYYDNPSHKRERQLPPNVEVYDAFANEDPKEKGFGDKQIEAFVRAKKPDVIVVYNDLIVLSTFLERLDRIQPRTFKIVPYIDLVYRNEKTGLINFINQRCDAAIMFTKYWESVIKSQGFAKPTYIMEHGFNRNNYYPVPQAVARSYFNVPDKDFVIVNLNRNQPRKRWDTCMMVFVKFIRNHLGEPIKLLIGTELTGAWDLVEIFICECRKYGLDPEEAKKHLIIIQNPQKVPDKEVNILYSVADVGINTCDGEGFGLCNFEQAAVGVPQIIPHIGGFRDFFDKDCAMCVPSKWSYYIDSSRDAVGGEAEICDVDDYVSALEQYYTDHELRKKHGETARKKILDNYKWPTMAARFRSIVKALTDVKDVNNNTVQLPPKVAAQTPMTTIPEEDNVDITQFVKSNSAVVESNAPAASASMPLKKKGSLFKDMAVFDASTLKPKVPVDANDAPTQTTEVVSDAASNKTKDLLSELKQEDLANKESVVEDLDSDEEKMDMKTLLELNRKLTRMLAKVTKS
jgi:glycosyltransferase involved in cell wall biosynthesis